MAFEIRQGPRGPEAHWNGRALTSSYDPSREAQRWAADLDAAEGSLVFVAGDPWGLGAQALGQRGLAVVALLPGPEARALVPKGVEAWDESLGTLEEGLQAVFDRLGPDAVVWSVWPAFERFASEQALDWSRRFRDLYRTVQGTWLTHLRFGPRWWRNCLRNVADWERPVDLVPGDKPVVIAASGPSLDDGLDLLARNRSRFVLWALPSSFETLVRRGLIPDAGVATDGGFYAREHLHRLGGTDVPVLAALSSAPDPILRSRQCLFFAQGLPIETQLLGALGRGAPEVPSQGTVAVTALRLALQATSGPVFIAGLDLAFRDVRGHTSPHTVDRRLEVQQSRLEPGEGLWSQRLWEQAPVVHEGLRTSPAMLTYARWFQTRARFSRPVFRIAPTALRWSSMVDVSWSEAQEHWMRLPEGRSPVWIEPARSPSREERREAVFRCLDQGKTWDPAVLEEMARTAVPEEFAADQKNRRRGRESHQAVEALARFLTHLRDEWT